MLIIAKDWLPTMQSGVRRPWANATSQATIIGYVASDFVSKDIYFPRVLQDISKWWGIWRGRIHYFLRPTHSWVDSPGFCALQHMCHMLQPRIHFEILLLRSVRWQMNAGILPCYFSETLVLKT